MEGENISLVKKGFSSFREKIPNLTKLTAARSEIRDHGSENRFHVVVEQANLEQPMSYYSNSITFCETHAW